MRAPNGASRSVYSNSRHSNSSINSNASQVSARSDKYGVVVRYHKKADKKKKSPSPVSRKERNEMNGSAKLKPEMEPMMNGRAVNEKYSLNNVDRCQSLDDDSLKSSESVKSV